MRAPPDTTRQNGQGPGPAPKRLRALKWVAAFGVAAAVGVGGVYAHYWSAVTHLPALVRTRVAVHRGSWTPLNQISPWFLKALIATEDRSFYTNWGISFQGIARALVVDLQTGRFTQGGSTLTQQLIRDILLSPRKTVSRKVTGTLLSILANALYPKAQILTFYVNEVYLGDQAYGIGAASRRYFGVAPARLTLPEAALLAGLPQAPTLYDPFAHYQLAKDRQQAVLDSMVAVGAITPAEAHSAFLAPLPLRHTGLNGAVSSTPPKDGH